jgi:hypothetical protein
MRFKPANKSLINRRDPGCSEPSIRHMKKWNSAVLHAPLGQQQMLASTVQSATASEPKFGVFRTILSRIRRMARKTLIGKPTAVY